MDTIESVGNKLWKGAGRASHASFGGKGRLFRFRVDREKIAKMGLIRMVLSTIRLSYKHPVNRKVFIQYAHDTRIIC